MLDSSHQGLAHFPFIPLSLFAGKLTLADSLRHGSTDLVATHWLRLRADQGATLSEWAGYLGCFASVSSTYAGNSSLPAFRDALAAAFAPGSRSFLGVNYLRTALGQAHLPIASTDRRR